MYIVYIHIKSTLSRTADALMPKQSKQSLEQSVLAVRSRRSLTLISALLGNFL